MKHTHLDLFEGNDEISLLKRELIDMRRQYEKIRRAAASRHNKLAKLCLALKDDNERLRRRIDLLEKAYKEKTGMTPDDDDFLKKLFEEAYLTSR